VLAGPPRRRVDIPASIDRLAAGRAIRPVWENELGGLTFELAGLGERVFVKWTPATSGIDLAAEAARLSWAARLTPVPEVLDRGANDEGAWLVMTAVVGETAVSERWKAEPGNRRARHR
jgi:kanamycin kinase